MRVLLGIVGVCCPLLGIKLTVNVWHVEHLKRPTPLKQMQKRGTPS